MTPPPAATHSLDAPIAAPRAVASFASAVLPRDVYLGARALWNRLATPQLICFACCGAIASVVFLGSFALMVATGLHYMIAGAVSAVLAVGTSFALNRRWTFAGPTKVPVGRIKQYAAIQVVAASCYLLLLHVFVQYAAVEPVILAQLLSAAVVSPMNFLASQRWGFR
jgi:putative flippase GtrA